MKAHAAPVTRDCILRLRAPNLKRWGPAESAAICHSSQGAVTRPLASGACALLTVRWSRQPSMCSRRVVRPPWPACADRDDHIAVHTSWWRLSACTLVTMRWSRQPSMCSRRVVRPPWPACADRDDHIAVHTSWWRLSACTRCTRSCTFLPTRSSPCIRLSNEGSFIAEAVYQRIPDSPRNHSVVVCSRRHCCHLVCQLGFTYHSSHEAQ
jgi:hypothetical protein